MHVVMAASLDNFICGGFSNAVKAYFGNQGLCIHDESLWNRIRSGDQVILHGRKSPPGFFKQAFLIGGKKVSELRLQPISRRFIAGAHA